MKKWIIGALALFGFAFSSAFAKDVATINVHSLRVRQAPRKTPIGYVHKNEQYDILGTRKDYRGATWYNIKMRNGRYGSIYAGRGYTSKRWVSDSKPKPKSKASTPTPVKNKGSYEVAVINTTWLRARQTPRGRHLTSVRKGEQYKILGTKRGRRGVIWYKIKLKDGRTAYIYSGRGYTYKKKVKVSTTPKKTTTTPKKTTTTPKKAPVKPKKQTTTPKKTVQYDVAVITAHSLRVRSHPRGTHIGSVRKGEEHKILGTRKDGNGTIWYKINYRGRDGYIYSPRYTRKKTINKTFTPIVINNKKFDFESDSSLQKFVTAGRPYNNITYVPQLKTIKLDHAIKTSRSGVSWKLRPEATDAFTKMAHAMYNDIHKTIRITSAYRSYYYQKSFSLSCKRAGRCAWEGTSEHQSGLAIDVGVLNNSFARTSQYNWLKNNAHKYGFTQSYQKGRYIDGYNVEARHWRYIGKDIATYLHEHNMTFTQLYKKVK